LAVIQVARKPTATCEAGGLSFRPQAGKARIQNNCLDTSKEEVSMRRHLSNPNRFHSKSFFKIVAAGALFFAATAWLLSACDRKSESGPNSPVVSVAPRSASVQLEPYPLAARDLSTAIEQVAKQTIPAVVHIEVTERQEIANPFLPYKNNPFFRYFFGLPKNMPKKFERELRGLGTGLIIDAQGNILSNYHVVGGATEIEVTLSDGTQYPAKVVGIDPKTDLGVIKIDAPKSLPFVTFADSDAVQVGQWVVAIGHPRGLDQTVTQGIISAKHRTGITNPSDYQDFLQTDAAINPGNSGGPLLNLQGQVVGVNSLIASESGGFEGIGFAIPSNMAVHVAQALIAHGKVERGWLGVDTQALTPDLAKSFGLTVPKGALIAEVLNGGPADKAGLKSGDVVLAYQGKEIPDASTLRNEVAKSSIGQEVKVGIWRNGQRQDITVTVGNLDDATKLLNTALKERLGVVVGPLTPKLAAKYGLTSSEGVQIQWVDPKGPFGKVGFEVGDIILAINQQPIQGVDGFDSVMKDATHHQKIVLQAVDHRTGQSALVQVEVP
jgi:serine protease Do